MGKILMTQTVRGVPAIRAKIKMRQAVKSKPKAKVPEKENGQDKA